MTARVLYRIFNSSDHLLYVGATTNPARRLQNHSLDKKWWRQATKITLEHFDTVEELNEAEIFAIQTESPRYNHVHAGKPRHSAARRTGDEAGVFQRADGMWVGSVEMGYGPSGKRRQRRVYSKDKAVAMQKLAEAKAEFASG